MAIIIPPPEAALTSKVSSKLGDFEQGHALEGFDDFADFAVVGLGGCFFFGSGGCFIRHDILLFKSGSI